MAFPLRLRTASALLLPIALFSPALSAQLKRAPLLAVDSHELPKAATPTTLAMEPSITIPGPLRSFLRMAGISQQVSPEEVLPLFARNVYVQGYVGWRDRAAPTEFLILLGRYVNQAKELAEFAGSSGVVHVASCGDAAPLLHILGYRMRETCGNKDVSLVTSDPERAFLTMDSGFPLSALEEALRAGTEFNYHYPETSVPLLFTEQDWRNAINPSKRDPHRELIELFLHHPSAARLYWALSRTDEETRSALVQKVGLGKLLAYSAELDFYGTQIVVRSGSVNVPGGAPAEKAWEDLVGASPHSTSDFVVNLLSRDKGWLAAFYDCMARTSPQQLQHFTDAHRLRMFYAAFRGQHPSGEAARPAFRLAPGLLLLLTRLQWDSQGQPAVPGGLDLWKEILRQKTDLSLVHEWAKNDSGWTRPDQLLEAMFAFSRLESETGPLQTYLLFSELDGKRGPDQQLKPETLSLMAKHFAQYSDQYVVFSEFPALDDSSIVSFINSANALDKISNHTLRGNAMGAFEANVGLWQILARQREIPAEKLNQSWQQAVAPFAKISSEAGLTDAGCSSLRAVFGAAAGKSNISQDEIIEILAGPAQEDPESRRVHAEMARSIRAVLDGQRLVSLDTLLALADDLSSPSRAASSKDALTSLIGELREFQMPRAIFSSSERSEWAAGIYNNRHTELQMQTDIAKLLKGSPGASQIDEARGDLAPFLRDTLVGLNYAYYEPPGAQLLRTDPLFVRSHDFAGETVEGVEDLWHAPQLFGAGVAAGGGAHLVGSLADLPYALSAAEQDFIVPENVQALIWRETVPGLLTSAILPRWWNVSKNELHGVALYQRAGEELLQSAESNADLRRELVAILSQRMQAEEISSVEQELTSGHSAEAISHLTPADSFFLTTEFRRQYPDDQSSWGPAGKELAQLSHDDPSEVAWERLSRDFGIPHPILEQTDETELLNVKPFPAFAGYSSRLMAESWDSNNLYWARLADEMGLPPAELNRIVPELTRQMVSKIFATDFEDWPALLRAMRETGKEFREGKIASGLPRQASSGGVPVN